MGWEITIFKFIHLHIISLAFGHINQLYEFLKLVKLSPHKSFVEQIGMSDFQQSLIEQHSKYYIFHTTKHLLVLTSNTMSANLKHTKLKNKTQQKPKKHDNRSTNKIFHTRKHLGNQTKKLSWRMWLRSIHIHSCLPVEDWMGLLKSVTYGEVDPH